MSGRILLVFLHFFWLFPLCAQQFTPNIYEETLTLAGQSRKGYITDFPFGAKEIAKEWWRFSKDFGRPLNMRSYYEITIPSDIHQGTVEITLYSKTLRKGSGSQFFLTLKTEKIPKQKHADYMSQVKQVMQNFKQTVYLQKLEAGLEKLEKKAAKASKRVEKSEGRLRTRRVGELEKLREDIQEYRSLIKNIYTAY
ncbi:hypothetical protein [Marinoscillum furvescens]|uniref:Uncharacterized protein n=1 Tax=Marinoscillum furvescens DSM 4134 TaxID=1122208 RepID=A0A3D9L4I4_MARFU|nr:hypothetical protein [Marinoscillum furvescens]REE00482.1 hypothetical protein C7460_105105 [Marinoscillum furvescens DSM 4134]